MANRDATGRQYDNSQEEFDRDLDRFAKAYFRACPKNAAGHEDNGHIIAGSCRHCGVPLEAV